METNSVILPMLSLLLGWFLNSFSPAVQHARDHRRALARVLADLLEVRHTLLAAEASMVALNRAPISPEERRIAWSTISTALPPHGELSKRFNETVSNVAAFDPLLGFQLREKDYVTKLGGFFIALESRSGAVLPVLNEIEPEFRSAILPHLTETILDVARRHGFRTTRKVKRLLGRDNKMPEDLAPLLAKVEALAKANMKPTNTAQTLGI